MAGPHAQWLSLGAGGLYGGNTLSNGSAMPVARSELEGMRLGLGRTPEASYPDGYLGTIRSRRDDRTLDHLKERTNQRSYQRGVHKGERIDPSDYVYPTELQPDRGLRAQRQARRQGPVFLSRRTTFVESATAPPHLVNDGKADHVANQPYSVDLKRQAQLKRLLPSWSV